MHLSALSSTPPPSRSTSALLGQASIHAGFVQPRHTIAIKLLAMPPVVRTLIALFMSEWFFWLKDAQTSMHVKHPRHFFISFERRIFGIA